MRSNIPVLVLLGLAFAAPAALASSTGGEAAWSVAKSTPDAAFRDPGYPAAQRALRRWDALPASAMKALRESNAAEGHKPLRIGIDRPLADAPATVALNWRVSADGGQTARVALHSAGAAALRAGLKLTGLPTGAELRFAAAGGSRSVVDVVTADAIEKLAALQPVYWTPVTDGDTQEIELYLPPGASPRWVTVGVAAVSHLVVSPTGDLSGAKIGESGACEIDTRCLTSPTTAFTNAKNAVARMVYQSNGGSFLCTGTLLNDTDNATQVPYFYTAAHCFTSQAEGNTLTTFWFYEATGCRTNVLDGAARQVGGGAQVLFANTASDVLFLRLNNTPPVGSYFLGWTSAPITTGTEFLAIHHPAGDVKKVSAGRVTGTGASNLASGSFIKAGYTDGTTEGGSSGCGLLTLENGELLLRGGLLGGAATCANTGTIGTPGNSDDYSRLDLAFTNLRQFLQPTTSQPPGGTDYSGLWSSPTQSGWGLVVMRGASGTYVVNIYHYDQDSTPTWYLSVGALNGAGYAASLSAFTGPWFGAPPFNPAQVFSRTAGNVSISFTTASTASLTFTIDGRTVTTDISRVAF
jgi:lysyl endopeptidase